MNSLFNMDNPVYKFLSRAFDIGYLNILFLICCVPVITIGPSAAALYYCMLKITRDSDSSITSMFFHSFKTNLKQGMIMTFFFGIALFILLVDIQACSSSEAVIAHYFKIFLYLVMALIIVVISYAFPLLAQFDNTTKNILKNSLIMALSNFGYTIVIAAFHLLPILMGVFLPELFLLSFPIWLCCGFSLIAFVNTKMYVKIFDQYIE